MENSVLIQVLSADDLFDKVRSIIREELTQGQSCKNDDPKYLTRKEAARYW